jgi:hypothetical protein
MISAFSDLNRIAFGSGFVLDFAMLEQKDAGSADPRVIVGSISLSSFGTV